MGKCIKKYNDLLLSNGQAKNDLPKQRTGWQYNCWGLTAYLKGWLQMEQWIYQGEISKLLDKYTVEVVKPELGDIAVFINDNTIILHTGILVDVEKRLIIHKRGAWVLSVNTIKHTMYSIYPDTEKVYYVREVEK